MEKKEREDILDAAIKKLIDDGLVEELMINGEPHYKLTALGESLAEATMVDPKTMN